MRTAESVVLTLCPPGPDERNTSMRRSFGSISTSTSSASGSTSTPAAEVWMRPCDSVAGTRCTRCTPPSYFSRAQTAWSGRAGADRDGDRLHAAEIGRLVVEHLGRPALPLGVAQVHPQQVAGEQRRLLAALAGLDLEDDVLAVVGVLRQQQLAQPVLELVDAGLQSVVGLGGERRVLGGQLARGAAGRRARPSSSRGAATIGASSAKRRPSVRARRLVGVHRRVGQRPLDLGVLGEQRRQARRPGQPGRLMSCSFRRLPVPT